MSTSSPTPLRILVVEDTAPLARAVKAALEHRAHQVAVAESALIALQLPAHDVVFCDVGLPDANGFDLVRSLRRRGDDSAFLFTSGRCDPECYRAAMELGAQGLFPKPFQLAEIVAAIEAAAQAKQSWCANRSSQIHFAVAPGTWTGAARRASAWLLERGVAQATRLRAATALAQVLEAPSAQPQEAEATSTTEQSARWADTSVSVRIMGNDCALEVERSCLATVSPRDAAEVAPAGLNQARALSDVFAFEQHAGTARIRMEFRATPITFQGDPRAEFADVDFFEPHDLQRLLLHARNESPLELAPAATAVLGRLLMVERTSNATRHALETSAFSKVGG